MFGSHAALWCQVADADKPAVDVAEDLIKKFDCVGGVEVHGAHSDHPSSGSVATGSSLHKISHAC